jgi:hypothetical protein
VLSGLEKIKSHRIWFVPDFVVWGMPGLGDVEYLATEVTPGASSVLFARTDIGDTGQRVMFSDLTDHRGNRLPDTISSPRVLPRPRATETAFIVGQEDANSFRVGRDSDGTEPITVDLLIIEMGE